MYDTPTKGDWFYLPKIFENEKCAIKERKATFSRGAMLVQLGQQSLWSGQKIAEQNNERFMRVFTNTLAPFLSLPLLSQQQVFKAFRDKLQYTCVLLDLLTFLKFGILNP